MADGDVCSGDVMLVQLAITLFEPHPECFSITTQSFIYGPFIEYIYIYFLWSVHNFWHLIHFHVIYIPEGLHVSTQRTRICHKYPPTHTCLSIPILPFSALFIDFDITFIFMSAVPAVANPNRRMANKCRYLYTSLIRDRDVFHSIK